MKNVFVRGVRVDRMCREVHWLKFCDRCVDSVLSGRRERLTEVQLIKGPGPVIGLQFVISNFSNPEAPAELQFRSDRIYRALNFPANGKFPAFVGGILDNEFVQSATEYRVLRDLNQARTLVDWTADPVTAPSLAVWGQKRAPESQVTLAHGEQTLQELYAILAEKLREVQPISDIEVDQLTTGVY